MKRLLFSLAAIAVGWSISAQAAILVGPAGSGTLTFNALPAAGDWSTLLNSGGGGDITDAAGLDAAVQTNVASAITTLLGTTATTTPAISSANIARWNSAAQSVQTVATTAGYLSLMATLQNSTGEDQSALTFSYDLIENHATGGTNANAVVEEVPGHRVYFSLTGAAGSWQVIPGISSIGSSGTLFGHASLGSWANGSLLYLLWADDNAQADRNNTNNEEGGYQIDNVTFKAGTITSVIPVGPGGSGTITFSSYPNALEGWFTHVNGGGTADLVDATGLDNAAQTNVAAAATQQLGSSATVNPSISSNPIARWNSVLQAVQTVATSAGYVSLMARLRNDSGSDQSALNIAYDLNELNADGTTVVEEVPGHRVYYSLSGDAGSWSVIPELSNGGTPGTLVASLHLGSWPAGSLLYLLRADDNANANRSDANDEEGGYTIDNITFSFSAINGVRISTPTNGQTFPEGVGIPINALAVLPGSVTDVRFLDGASLVGSDAASPFGVVLSNASLGAHILTATATDDLANVVTSAGVIITVVPNHPPSVAITTPVAGSNFFVGANFTCQATASDTDGSVARTEFYLDGTLLFTDATNPYSFEVGDITAGPHALSAVAVDNGGFRATNTVSITATNPPGIVVIVPNGSTWKYLDDGSGQGTEWRDTFFDDSGWNDGVAELGYGDATGNNRPERTVVSFGPDANGKHPTTYFRKIIDIANPSDFASLTLRLLRDDGGIVYFNSSEVFRSGITNEVVDFSTFTPPAVADDGTVFQEISLDTSVLFPGLNTIAVEIHQDAGNSSDISFDLMLWGIIPAGPVVDIAYDSGNGSITITWPGGGTLICADDLSTPRPSWTPVLGATSPYVTQPSAAHRFYAVSVP